MMACECDDEKCCDKEKEIAENKENSEKICDEKCYDEHCHEHHEEHDHCHCGEHGEDHHSHDEEHCHKHEHHDGGYHECHDDCGCGCDHHDHGHHNHGRHNHGCHEHEHDDCGCGCGHDHGAEPERGGTWKLVLRYVLGALPIILAFITPIPLPVRIVFAIIGYAVFGFEVWRGMIRGFCRKRIFTEFTLMCVASVGAFAIGEFADAAAVVYLYSLGEMFSDRAYVRSRKNISELLEITPEYATVIRNGEAIRLEPHEVNIGETVLVVTGERVPLDGVVIEGGADADTSSVTGEAMPLALYEGVECPSGAVISNGTVKIRTVSNYENSVVARMTEAVRESSKRKSASEKQISKFASVFTPIAFGVAFAIALVGSLISGDVVTWLKAGLVVLVVSCPCSLVLSVPLTYFAGMGAAASRGIIFKGGEVMDSLKRLRGVAFDKTGTLTHSRLDYDGVEMLDNSFDKKKFLSIAHGALTYSPHAAARSFCDSYKDSCKEVNEQRVEDARNIGGRGIVAKVDGHAVLFGNGALMRENGIDVADSKRTCIFGAVDGALVGRLDFSSKLKEGAKDTIRELTSLGASRIAVISGDGEEAVKEASEGAGIGEYYFSVTPDEKADIFERISKDEKALRKDARVAYCGDGLNDSAVIAMADVGVAMGRCGAALTVDSADVILMDDNVTKLCEAIRVSRRTSRIATQNIVISLGIKIGVLIAGVIISAMGGSVPMELAIVADVGAALIAVVNALRAMRGVKKRKRNKEDK